MKIVIAQLNPVVGDVDGNMDRLEAVVAAHAAAADLVVFPELYATGYPPRDLLDRPHFVARAQAAVDRLVAFSRRFPSCGVLCGFPLSTGRETGKGLYNAAVLACGGAIAGIQAKSLLPDYDVFDEARYFDPAAGVAPIPFGGELLGVSICEDAWNDPAMWPGRRRYTGDPIADLRAKGATLMVNVSASPFDAGKEALRFKLLSGHARRHGVPFVYANQVGANDELIFDGASLCVDAAGEPVAVFPSFAERIAAVNTAARGAPGLFVPRAPAAEILDALVLGVRDYLKKTGFSKAVVGLSGGIDSAVVCAIAAAALGPENVLGVSMPSPYSSAGSIDDARALAKNLGVELTVVPIAGVFSAYLDALKEQFAGRAPGIAPGIAEENIQARIRGNILMAFSNKLGHLVLSTGNKSELAVGYCTLYGDMSGGLAVISDVPKTMVYRIAGELNARAGRDVIPRATIEKPPSAELKPDQKDQDTLPPYEILDAILQLYVEEALPAAAIAARGFSPATVEWVVRTIVRSEYKRRQAAPGLRVSTKAFGIGRRMPVAAKY